MTRESPFGQERELERRSHVSPDCVLHAVSMQIRRECSADRGAGLKPSAYGVNVRASGVPWTRGWQQAGSDGTCAGRERLDVLLLCRTDASSLLRS